MRVRQPLVRVVSSLIIGVVVLLPSVALATNFGSYYADNKDHYWHDVALTTNGATATTWGLNRINATDVDTHDDGSCMSGTDICFFDWAYETYGGGGHTAEWWEDYVANARCITSVGGGKCGKWHIEYDTDDIDSFSNTDLNKLGCHEVGHTVGLKHYTTSTASCMYNPPTSASTSYYNYSHEVTGHVNGRY